MSTTLSDAVKSKELRKKILYTFLLLLITRIGAYIPIPGIDPKALTEFFRSQGGAGNSTAVGLTEYLNFFSGGAFSNFSVLMLGVMPYISAQIIIQLLMIIVPKIRDIAQDPSGQLRIQRWTRYSSILVCLLQSFAVTVYSQSIPNLLVVSRAWFIPIALISCTAGSMFMVWLGERITEKGIGNGISLLIFAGIVARIPEAVFTLGRGVAAGTINPIAVAVLFVVFIAVVVLVIYEEMGERKIYVTYSKRIVGRKVYGAGTSHIPFKLNPSGVMPIIFASAILSFPLMMATALGPNVRWLQRFANWLNPQGAPYIIIYTILIIAFAFFYTQITLNPIEIAKQIRDNGGTIQGVRVDRMEEYLTKVLNRIILPGSLFLAFIALLPTIVQLIFHFPSNVAMLFGGTSLLIMVGVELETARSLEAAVKSKSKLYIQAGKRRTL